MTNTTEVSQPLASPANVPLTEWNDWRQRLAGGVTYQLATVAPTGRPHVVPVLAIWLDEALHFTSRASTRKSAHLEVNPRCVLSIADVTFDLTVEGNADIVEDVDRLTRAATAFSTKYPWWHPTVSNGSFYPDGIERAAALLYQVVPDAVFGFDKEHGFKATRWTPAANGTR